MELNHFSEVLCAQDSNVPLRVIVEDATDVIAAVGNGHLRLVIGGSPAPDLSWHVVMATNAVAAVVAHGYLLVCAALRAGGGMVAIWFGLGYYG